MFFIHLLMHVILCNVAFATESQIPLKADQWKILSFNKIPANKVEFKDEKMIINVQASAGPLVYKFSEAQNITGFSLSGRYEGVKKTESSAFDEDAIIRIGLVATGDQRLSGVKKMLAADWVKELFKLAPKGTGLDKIYFFNTTDREALVKKTRPHPKSELIYETISWDISADKNLQLVKKLKLPITTAAIWMSIDGDDTKSDFKVIVDSIKVLTEPKNLN